MELEITWRRMLPIFWAFLWRFIVCICVEICAFGTFALIYASTASNHPVAGCSTDAACHEYMHQINHALMPSVLALIPLFFLIILKFLVGKDFGDFRLVLLSRKSAMQSTEEQR